MIVQWPGDLRAKIGEADLALVRAAAPREQARWFDLLQERRDRRLERYLDRHLEPLMQRDEAVDSLFQDFSALVQRLRNARETNTAKSPITRVHVDAALHDVKKEWMLIFDGDDIESAAQRFD